jgi:hypothetical protein
MIRVPRQFNGSFITRHFFSEYLKHGYVAQINSGRCYDWAYFAHRMFGVKLWTTDYHAWCEVWIPSKRKKDAVVRRYFDAESRHGVRNFMDLKCNKRNAFPLPWEETPPTQLDLQDFKSLWDEIGAGDRRHWLSKLEPKLRCVLGKRYSELTPIFPRAQSARVVP